MPPACPAPSEPSPFVLISRYTRAEAIADGVLVEIAPGAAKLAGINAPLAMTATAHAAAECGDPANLRVTLGRAVKAAFALAASESTDCEAPFSLATDKGLQEFKLHVGGGDNGELVFTIMLKGED